MSVEEGVRLGIYDRETYISCCVEREDLVSDKFVLVGRPAVDQSAREKKSYESQGIQFTPKIQHNADEVPIEIAHIVSPEMWKSFFEDLQAQYDASWTSKLAAGPCNWHDSMCCCCFMCRTNACGCCITGEIKGAASTIISKHESSFRSVGCKMENMGINSGRYSHFSTGDGNSQTVKEFDNYTLSIKFTPNNPNPDLPTAPAAASMVRGLTGAATTAGPGSAKVVPLASEDPTEKLVKLKKLLDAGVITQEDFDHKNNELLAQM
jgi:hypothetical protein